MQDLNVTLVQANQIWEDKQANLKHYTSLLAQIETTDLVVLPEMFHTGFSMNAEALAETMEDSEGLDWLRCKAKEFDSAFYTSLIIKEKDKYYNRGVFVHPEGKIETYDKRKSFGLAGEDEVYTAGTERKIVNYKNWNIQLQICYDLRFPEISRNHLVNETPLYDLLIYVANWPEKRSLHWTSLLAARAIENQAYVVGVNRVGVDGKELNYSGDSMLIDLLGNINSLNPSNVEVKTIQLSYNNLTEKREMLPFLKDQ
jgi:omega-amidase